MLILYQWHHIDIGNGGLLNLISERIWTIEPKGKRDIQRATIQNMPQRRLGII